MRYRLVNDSYNDCCGNIDAKRYERLVKRCLKLATRIYQSEEHYTELIQVLDDFEDNCEGLTIILKLSLNNASTKIVTEK